MSTDNDIKVKTARPTLFCCRVLWEILRGRSPKLMIPGTKFRYFRDDVLVLLFVSKRLNGVLESGRFKMGWVWNRDGPGAFSRNATHNVLYLKQTLGKERTKF